VHALAVTASQNHRTQLSVCIQRPAVTTVAHTPFRPAAARCALERGDGYLCTILSAEECNLMILVSGNVRFMRIIAGVPWKWGVKRQCGCRQWLLSVLSLAVFSETLEIRPASLHVCSDTESLVGFPLISKHVTLNGPE